MIILGIETSCDDTGIALIECDKNKKCRILSNVISSQIKVHAPYGGVVPNLAARAHLKNIEPVLQRVLKDANHPKIDLIAVTQGPGLIPCLLVGVNFAKALAYNWNIPVLGINHIKAHIYANWLNSRFDIESSDIAEGKVALKRPNLENFPILSLVVSGGHTQLVLMKKHNDFKILGETRDDAAGEAFDKVAKLLGLGYPGGPIISQRALKGDSSAFDLPRPMINNDSPAGEYDFSFSGLKTAVLYLLKRQYQGLSLRYSPSKKDCILGTVPVSDICASFQQAVIDVLINKTIKAAKKNKIKTVILSGGVAANQELRNQMEKAVKGLGIKFQMPDIKLCTDNGAMIALAAAYKKKPTSKQSWLQINANSNLKFI